MKKWSPIQLGTVGGGLIFIGGLRLLLSVSYMTSGERIFCAAVAIVGVIQIVLAVKRYQQQKNNK
ncbi:hypothetical protein OQI89_05375 [Lentilactobacillus diolivorans]|uniref:hypothetical protein n=1 Tax=Lentilactobacillus diolivorans TaxID=179838 RepID=UPI002468E235|nr:hypothetical protein [Lentilactobacillus diolivorans]MDH5105285.1 hypothetical protein [Lentilactobacillus diolivorans]